MPRCYVQFRPEQQPQTSSMRPGAWVQVPRPCRLGSQLQNKPLSIAIDYVVLDWRAIPRGRYHPAFAERRAGERAKDTYFVGAISQSILGARWSGLNDAAARHLQMNVHLSLFLLAPWVVEKNGRLADPRQRFFGQTVSYFRFLRLHNWKYI